MLWGSPWVWTAAPFLLLGFCSLCFFRDPPRSISQTESDLVSPADGKVVGVDDLNESPYYEGPCRRVAIFLSVLNVHVNRSSYAGRVTKIDYQPGEFLNALDPESAVRNECNTIWMNTAYGAISLRQISGLIARRIVCKAEVGDELAKGERFGMIKFGSRTELFVPPETEICVKIGQNVRGGATVMARFKR
jgi:phosphatidylserine decarboxylase